MAKFNYKAKRGVSEVIEGVIEAQGQEDAVNKLLAQGLFPVSLAIAINGAAAPKANKERPKRFFLAKRGISPGEILTFTQKLLTLTRAKVELLSSLRILCEQTENPAFKEVIQAVYDSTREGKTFSDSLQKFPKVFPSLFVNIVKSGETSGKMDFALEQIAEFLQREEGLKTKIRLALAYPALLLIVGMISIFVLISFVIPKLTPIFSGIKQELPLITKIVLKVSAFSNKFWFVAPSAIAALILLIYNRKGSVFYNKLVRKIKTNLPVVKRLLKNQELAQFARSLCLLLKGGVVALKSLEIATLTIEDPKLKAQMKKVYEQVADGQSLARSMEQCTGLPKFFTRMVAVGEESGRLGEVLEEILRSYTQQIEADIALVSSLLEPVLILGLGLILGTIVLSILLPTFQITQAVR